MPSLDFEAEKSAFRDFHSSNYQLLEDAKNSFLSLTNALLIHSGSIAISKIEGRVKDREECIKKFNLKYRTQLEANSINYSIRDHITDLIGLRVVCLYEDDIEKIDRCLSEHFEIVDRTDKISQIENTEGSFGYKGLHLNLQLNQDRKNLPEYVKYSEFKFEIQIRTIIQDSWSVLDHKIKYKKSIPTRLKRRINTLAALFELADREFREIRDSTAEEIKKEEISDELLEQETNTTQGKTEEKSLYSPLNAFSFLKVANHFFSTYSFEAHKVDGFTQEIVSLKPNITRGKFNFYMRENISKVKRYQTWLEQQSNPTEVMNPYTVIRHCLFLGDKEIFASILTNVAKENFERWLSSNS